jgi:hypothetical protein
VHVFFVYRFHNLDHGSACHVSACDSNCFVIAISIFRVSSYNYGRPRPWLDAGLVDTEIAYSQVCVKDSASMLG